MDDSTKIESAIRTLKSAFIRAADNSDGRLTAEYINIVLGKYQLSLEHETIQEQLKQWHDEKFIELSSDDEDIYLRVLKGGIQWDEHS